MGDFKIGDKIKDKEGHIGQIEAFNDKAAANGRKFLVRWHKGYASWMQARAIDPAPGATLREPTER